MSWGCWSVLAPVCICAPYVCTDLLLCSLLLSGVSVTIRWGKEPDFYLGIKVSLGKLQRWGDRKKPGGSPVFLGGAWAGCCWEREDGRGFMELLLRLRTDLQSLTFTAVTFSSFHLPLATAPKTSPSPTVLLQNSGRKIQNSSECMYSSLGWQTATTMGLPGCAGPIRGGGGMGAGQL